jgi:nucleotide-binding universal stress UspA family protein
VETQLNGILLATDGSEDSALAARAAMSLSARTGAALHLVHVWNEVTPMAYPAMEVAVGRHGAEDEARSLLEREAEMVEWAEAPVAGTHLRRGRPAEEIVGLSEELDVDLVVVGSRGIGPVRRLVMGSTSEGVVNLASRPTLVVRGGEDSWPPHNVVVGDDTESG